MISPLSFLVPNFLIQYDTSPYPNWGNKIKRKEEMALGEKKFLQFFILSFKWIDFIWICSELRLDKKAINKLENNNKLNY